MYDADVDLNAAGVKALWLPDALDRLEEEFTIEEEPVWHGPSDNTVTVEEWLNKTLMVIVAVAIFSSSSLLIGILLHWYNNRRKRKKKWRQAAIAGKRRRLRRSISR